MGQDARVRYADFNPSLETIVTAPSVSPGSDLVHITASNVTLDGFVIDGNNEVNNGIDTIGSASASNLLIENNIVQNVNYGGVMVLNSSVTAPASSGNTVTKNVITNFADYGVKLAYNAYGDVTNYTLSSSQTTPKREFRCMTSRILVAPPKQSTYCITPSRPHLTPGPTLGQWRAVLGDEPQHQRQHGECR